jgi:type IV pilus assembly protein PilQ
VEIVIEGTGPAPVLQQGTTAGGGWAGQLRTATPSGLRLGPQRLSLPEAGLQLVSFQGSGNTYQVLVEPMPGAPLGRPVVSADGRNLVISFATAPQISEQTARLDLRIPGAVPQPSYAPLLQPRAVAPPLGDMAVGSMVLRNRSFLHVNGPAVSMTMRNAPARDVLMAVAQMGGYGFVYVDDDPPTGTSPAGAATESPRPPRVPIALPKVTQLLTSGAALKASSSTTACGPPPWKATGMSRPIALDGTIRYSTPAAAAAKQLKKKKNLVVT